MINYFLQKPVPVLLSFFLLSLSGVWLTAYLPLGLLPEVELSRIRIHVEVGDLNPGEIEIQVMAPARNQFRYLQHLEEVKTLARQGGGWIDIIFSPGTDMDYAWFEAQSRLDDLLGLLSLPLKRPTMQLAAATDFPIVELAVLPQGLPEIQDFSSWSGWAKQLIVKRLEQIPGVAFADIGGGSNKLISVAWKNDRLLAPGCTDQEIEQALRMALGPGKIFSLGNGNSIFEFEQENNIKRWEDLKNLPVCDPMFNLKLTDMVFLSREDVSGLGSFSLDGTRGLVCRVYQKPGADVLSVRKAIHQLIRELNTSTAAARFQVLRDQTALVVQNLESLLWSLFLAFVAIMLLLVWVYGKVKLIILLGLSIPLTLLLSLNGIYALGITLNSFSLFGLIIGNGLVIDNGIVILENIIRKKGLGCSPLKACAEGAGELVGPIFASSATTGVVFLPLTFLDGLTGVLFAEQLQTIGIALVSSVLVSLVLIPVVSFHWFSETDYLIPEKAAFSGKGKMVVWAVGTGYLCWVALGFFAYRALPTSIFPDLPSEGVSVYLNAEVEQTKTLADTILRGIPGGLDIQFAQYSGNPGFFLEDKENMTHANQWVFHFRSNAARLKVIGLLNEQVPPLGTYREPLKGVFQHVFSQYYQNKSFVRWYYTGPGGFPSQVALKELMDWLQQKDFGRPLNALDRQWIWSADPTRAATYGITREELQFNKTYWDPRLMGNTPLEGYDVVLSPTISIKSDFLGQSVFRTRSGLLLPTMAFSDVRRSSDLKVVQGDLDGMYIDIETQRSPKWNILAGEPGDWKLVVSDLAVGEQRQIQQRLLLLASTLLLLYLLLAILFNDLSLPFYVLAVLPAGLGGAVIALYLGGDSLNIVALTGIVLVCGIVVNDAILKVDLVVRLSRTLSVEKAVMQASRERWRAIVMTSLTTAVSLAPAIWGSEFSHVFQRPLALAVIGGLLGGTLASLWFIPHLFKSKL